VRQCLEALIAGLAVIIAIIYLLDDNRQAKQPEAQIEVKMFDSRDENFR
jgi:hypothetical protein